MSARGKGQKNSLRRAYFVISLCIDCYRRGAAIARQETLGYIFPDCAAMGAEAFKGYSMSAERQGERHAAPQNGSAAGGGHEGGREQGLLPRLFYIILIAAGLACAVMAIERSLDEYWVLLLVSLYAAVGVFFLLCAAFGLCRFGGQSGEKAAAADILDNLPPAIILTDRKGRFIYANKAYRQISGAALRTPDILLGRDARAAGAVCRLSKAAAEGQPWREILPFDGLSAGACSADVRPFFSGGYALAMWTISESAAERAAAPIRNLQEAVRYFDKAPAGILSWDKTGRAVFFNASLARLVHYDFSGASAVPSLADLLGAENAQAVFAWGQALKEPAAGHSGAAPLCLPIIMPDGSGGETRLYFCADIARGEDNLSHALILPAAGAAAQFAAQLGSSSAPDGSAAAAEQNSADPENFAFTSYFYRSPIALAVIHRDWREMEFNACFAALFGLPFGEEENAADGSEEQSKAARRNISRFFAALAEPCRSRLLAAVKAGFQPGQDGPVPVEAVAAAAEAGQEPRSIRLYITPAPIGGAVGAVIISAVETTRQRALERQMEHSEKMQAVGQLAGGIAHDFNNVLTAIIMSCDLLLSSHRISDPSHPDIINIKHNAERAAALVRQLLAFSRRQTLRSEILDITDRLADMRMLAMRLAGSNVQLKIEHGHSLWPVEADQIQLQRVIMNLVSNARDAMPQGGALTIRTENIGEAESRALPYQGFAAGDYVLIEVADTGSGIEPEIIERIFDPFFTTKEVGKGTGLGLSSVYGIISQMGGYIHCRSAVGEGTVFSIYLPRAVIREAADAETRIYAEEAEAANGEDYGQAQTAAQAKGGAAARLSDESAAGKADLSGSANVLLVEDEDAVRMGGVKALQSRGYAVFEAESGVEALRIIKERQGAIDIVVSDVVMPEMDGPTLLRELRRSYPNIKFIFVSGYAREAFAKNLPEDTEFSFLPKPFSLKQLAGAVKTVLQGQSIG